MAESKFDLKVHHRNPKTNVITRVNSYRMKAVGGQQYYERPVGSGEWYFKSGERCEDNLLPASIRPKAVKEEPKAAQPVRQQKASKPTIGAEVGNA